jgi:hypothetical protein
MKQITLITLLFLLSGISAADFEIEDPAEIMQEMIKENNTVDVSDNNSISDGVIVPVGSKLYAPSISNETCDGWRFDESEPSMNGDSENSYVTQTTYIGDVIKSIDCSNEIDAEELRLKLVRIEQSRLIWVKSDSVLKAKQ